ncbi:DUF4173 domain-containing protein [Bradyrhizobium sediminis]|uniref:DUF4173 domain-containing protein n=1 Tax=Bradyrhizobium sediminis TaxID=2840469 RepID=A0A975RTG1_9BRAD|nr:DUF4173 domain-containing protein [Bradyrhizobium sediminis]QWG19620.1 DUF4173 domain-containing protein [Bradyrhizobium sediminis]
MSIATASDLEIAPARPLRVPFVAAASCIALADWLFYGWPIGISLALFLVVLGGVAVTGNGVQAARGIQIAMTAVFVAGLLPLIEGINALSVTVAALATALFVILITAREPSSWQRNLFEAATTPFRGPFQLAVDLFRSLQSMNGQLPQWLSAASLVGWIIPLAACFVFFSLFASANPLIEYRLHQIDLRAIFSLLDPRRIGFWFLTVCAIWPLILRRFRWKVRDPEPRAAVATEASDLNHLFGVQAVTRSLLLFNALFALQSGLDLAYLWGGASLPDGMSHAQYAHRGAYPLIVTALLAAGFVLIAMRPGGPADHSRLIRPLVLAWIGQNILLVISSIFRLDLYVAAYTLTYLRLAAFIWMILVATGLLLILIQIVLKKPNSWLLTANAVSLALVLYGCCFINVPRLVASYNVEHCRENGGTGPNLDLRYLASLGPQALPPVEASVNKIPVLWSIARDTRHNYEIQQLSANWRGFGFRTWRLDRYLANNPYIAQNPLDGGKG